MIARTKAFAIRCAKCDKPVDDVYAQVTDYGFRLRITATCHGRTDYRVMKLTDALRRALEDGVKGTAFDEAPARLEAKA